MIGSIRRNMNTQRSGRHTCQAWGNEVYVDEVFVAEYQKLFPLMETIYTNALATEIERLCIEHCCGCKIDHPSQRQHDCLMMCDEERLEMYCKDAIGLVNEKRMIWNEFVEATRVLKIRCHRDALERLRHLESTSESMLYALWQLYSNTETPEMKCILGYLAYWREGNK